MDDLSKYDNVLILIVMEYALRYHLRSNFKLMKEEVLILIVMEYALRLYISRFLLFVFSSLNPYCNGICT